MAAKQTKSSVSDSGQGRTTTKKSRNAKQASHNSNKGRSSEKITRERQGGTRTNGESETIRDEVLLVVTLLVSLLLILSYINLCGPIGKGINYVVFGLIGFFAYLFPFALFFMTAFSLSNRGNHIAKRKMYSGCGMLLVLTAIIQLLAGYDKEMSLFDYFTHGADYKSGGGFIGGILVKLLCPLFGTIATVVILIALLIIFFMLITGKAIFTYLAKKGEESFEYHRKQRNLRNQALEEDMEGEDGYPERRKPRIVSFTKADKNDNQENREFEEKEVKEEEKAPVSFLDQLKKKGKSGKSEETEEVLLKKHSDSLGTNYDVEEIVSEPTYDFSISGDFRPTNEMIHEVNEIYEDELKKKFGETYSPDTEYTAVNDEFIQDGSLSFVDTASYEQKTSLDLEANEYYEKAEGVHKIEEVAPDNTNTSELNNKEKRNEGAEKQEVVRVSDNTGKTQNDVTAGNEAFISPVIAAPQVEEKKYIFPSLDLLSKPKNSQRGMTDKDLKETATKLQKTLESFGVRVTITNVSCGPAVTRYELQPEQGVKVSKITGLADDIKLNLAAADVRIEAPIPGKAAVGIEVPNKENSAVMLRELLDTKDFKEHSSDIAFAVGKDIGGQAVVTDIAKMPHLLIAGATGSGKSVCINTLIMSILYKANPSDVKLIMVDPKVVELSVYNGIPHLLIPVVTDPKKASAALNWAVMEMTDRYKKFADLGVRDLKGYNERVAEIKELNDPNYQKLPQIVIIVDELADLMMVAPGEVEDAICRLAQMARAAGLHLIIATQRPSVNVITGLIKANVPSRIAFSVSSAIDSRTIIDGSGAEKLLGKGDMLFFPSGYPKPVRIQGAFVSDKEVSAVVDFLKEQNSITEYSEEVSSQITSVQSAVENSSSGGASGRDDYFVEAGKFIIEKDKASIGMLQRVYKIGFNRAARIMDQLADAGVVGPEEGTKPRKVLMSLEEFEQFVDEYV